MYEEEQPGLVLQHRGGHRRRDGTYSGRYRKNHLPQVRGSGRSSTSARATWLPGIRPPRRPIGVYICYDGTSLKGWRGAGLAGAKIVFNPFGEPAAAVVYSGSGAARRRGRQRVLHRRDQPGGVEPLGATTSTARPIRRPARPASSATAASDTARQVVVRDLDLES